MAIILNLETTSKCCSVALSKDGWTWIVQEDHSANGHAELLTIFIQKVLANAQIDWTAIDAIAISKGPGSYTGLRIGTSTAKGICYALQKPLIAVDTLESLAWATQQYYQQESSALVSLIDARRMDAYAAVFDSNLQVIQEPYFCTLTSNSFLEHLEKNNIDTLYITGDASSKYQELLAETQHSNIIYSSIQSVSARYLGALAEQLYHQKQFEDIAYFEPFYLKTPHITKPSSKKIGIS